MAMVVDKRSREDSFFSTILCRAFFMSAKPPNPNTPARRITVLSLTPAASPSSRQVMKAAAWRLCAKKSATFFSPGVNPG